MLNKVYTYGFILDIHAPLTSIQTGSAALRLNCGLFLEKGLRRTCTGGTDSLWSKPPRTSEFDRGQANMVVCGQVGVVEGNRFAGNAREWSPRGAKIKTVFNFRSTGIFGARRGRTFLGPAFFYVSTPPVHNFENSLHFDTLLGGGVRYSITSKCVPPFFFWQIIGHFRPEFKKFEVQEVWEESLVWWNFHVRRGGEEVWCRQYIVNLNNWPNFIYF